MSVCKVRLLAGVGVSLLLVGGLIGWLIVHSGTAQAQTGPGTGWVGETALPSGVSLVRTSGGSMPATMGMPRRPRPVPLPETLVLPSLVVAGTSPSEEASLPPITVRGTAPEPAALPAFNPMLTPPQFQPRQGLLARLRASVAAPGSQPALIQEVPPPAPVQGFQQVAHAGPSGVAPRPLFGQSPLLPVAVGAPPAQLPVAATPVTSAGSPLALGPVPFPGAACGPGQGCPTGPEGCACLPPEMINACMQRGTIGLLDNFSLFAGLNGAKTPEDLGINGNFGGRVHLNWGIPLSESLGLGLHLGAALNFERTALPLLELVEGTRDRTQNFTTVGVFQQSPLGFSWELALDYLSENYYSSISAMQWRGLVGYDVGACDRVGLWGTWRARSDQATVAGQTIFLRPINQLNLFWRHVWENDNVTRIWIGVAEEHGRFNLFAPGAPALQHPFCFGGDIYFPLTNSLALYGEAQFISPGDSGTITALLGLAWFPGGGARVATRGRFAPVLPVANSTSFALDVQQ